MGGVANVQVLPVPSVANVGRVMGGGRMRPLEVGCSKAASALPQGRGRKGGGALATAV